jgi:Type II secretion system protein C
MSLGRKVFAAPARLWMNWPLWGGLLAMLLLAKHAWVLFAPAERAVPATTIPTQSVQAEQLFGVVNTNTSSASLSGIRPIGIFASKKNGFAVMQTETGQVGVGVGGQVVPGVRLVETHPDYVILERNGAQQRVELSKAPAAAGGIQPVPVVGGIAPVRSEPVPAASGQLTSQLTPEQRAMLQQQQLDLIRGRH